MKQILFSLFTLGILLNSAKAQTIDYDSTYATNGVSANLISGIDHGYFDVVLTPDQKAVVVGGVSSLGGNGLQGLVARYKINGTLDSSFGVSGKTIFGNPADFSSYSKAQLQTDGKFVVCGYNADANFNYQNLSLARFNVNGNLDSSFGTNGVFSTPINGSLVTEGADFKIQTDGKIVVSGYYDDPILNSVDFTSRHLPNGTLDSSFGINGVRTITTIGTINYSTGCNKIQTDGKILIGGRILDADGDAFIARLKTDGSMDSSFGTNGIAVVPIPSNFEQIYSIDIQKDDKIVFAGDQLDFSALNTDLMLGRMNTNGTLDLSYNTIGYGIIDISSADNEVHEIKVQTDGKVLLVGSNYFTNNSTFSLSRYKLNGSLDSTFNNNGIKELNITGDVEGWGLDLQTDGKIVAVGYNVTSTAQSIICRLKNNVATLAVTSPNGGESWVTGSTQNITWNTNNVTNVNIEYTIDGSIWNSAVANTPSTGTYAWTVPTTPSANCLVRITDASNNFVTDQSDAKFSIVYPTGISGVTKENLFIYSPNPANQLLNIRLVENKPTTIIVTDLNGKIIEQFESSSSIQLNTASYINGIYSLTVLSGDHTQTNKFVVQH